MKDILGNILDDIKIQKFQKYYELLVDWNEKINLTAITEKTEVATKHFLDSILITESGKFTSGAKVIDVGTGAGFPGLPLKIFDESLNVTLMDSLGKRINFLNEVINELSLESVETIHSRAEDLGQDKNHRECYDIAASRAVANLSTLSELCLPFVKVGGYFISLKGPNVENEIADAKNAIKLLGAEIENVVNYDIPGTDLNHNMVIIKKVLPTSTKYPRKAPKPAKEPLK